MSQTVVNGALLRCSFGVAPGSLTVLPLNRTMTEGRPQANILDSKPILNIPTFGVCSSLANPQTATLTAAALGVLTPGPCMPVTPAPWVPGSATVVVAGAPALNANSTCTCIYGGVVSIAMAGTAKTTVP